MENQQKPAQNDQLI